MKVIVSGTITKMDSKGQITEQTMLVVEGEQDQSYGNNIAEAYVRAKERINKEEETN